MRKKYGVIFAVIGYIIFFFCEGWGADWKLYGGETAYYDAQSIIRQKDGWFRVWTKRILLGEKLSSKEARGKWLREHAPYAPQGKEMFLSLEEFDSMYVTKELLLLREINCSNRTFRTLAISERDKDGLTVMGYLSNPKHIDGKIYHVSPDLDMERLYKIICK